MSIVHVDGESSAQALGAVRYIGSSLGNVDVDRGEAQKPLTNFSAKDSSMRC